MTEGYLAETASTTADYQAALGSFLVATAAAMSEQAQWVVWAARCGFAAHAISGYNDLLIQTAELNKQAVQSFIIGLGEQSLSVWINEPDQELGQFVGLHYSIGDPRYWIGIRPEGGEKTYVPYNAAQHSIAIREQRPSFPATGFDTLRRGATAAADAIMAKTILPENERFDPRTYRRGPFETPSSFIG